MKGTHIITHVRYCQIASQRTVPSEYVIIFPQLCHLLDEGGKKFLLIWEVVYFHFPVNLRLSIFLFVYWLLLVFLLWSAICIFAHFSFGSSVFFITGLEELLLNSRCCGCKTDWLPDISLRDEFFGFIVENCSSGSVPWQIMCQSHRARKGESFYRVEKEVE